MRKDGGRLTVVVGYQCAGAPGGFLHRLRVTNYDRGTGRLAAEPLWEITAEQAAPTGSVVLGEVPPGYRATADNLAAQPLGATVSVEVDAGGEESMLFDVARMRDGKVLDADWKVVPEASFFAAHAC